ncbi:MAG: hypothetical protein ACI311_01930 [Bacilli bacterium]
MFFKPKEINMAKKHGYGYLQEKYSQSEKKLAAACRTGKMKNVRKAMKEHHTYEYALLYKQYKKH